MDCLPGQKRVAVVGRWPLVEVRLYHSNCQRCPGNSLADTTLCLTGTDDASTDGPVPGPHDSRSSIAGSDAGSSAAV